MRIGRQDNVISGDRHEGNTCVDNIRSPCSRKEHSNGLAVAQRLDANIVSTDEATDKDLSRWVSPDLPHHGLVGVKRLVHQALQ